MDFSELTVNSSKCRASKVAEVDGVEYFEAAPLPPPYPEPQTFTYEVQHDTECYVYFNMLEYGEFTKHNFRAPIKAMRHHGLPTSERQQFVVTAEQRKRFRFFEKN